jgi:hypothetical protein
MCSRSIMDRGRFFRFYSNFLIAGLSFAARPASTPSAQPRASLLVLSPLQAA